MARQPRQSNLAGAAPQVARGAAAPRVGDRRGVQARNQHPRHTREQQSQRLVLIAGGAIVLIVVLLLGVGWYQSYSQPYGQTVISVGSISVKMRYFISRMKQLVPEFSNADPQVVVSALPEATKQSIESDLVVLQRADRLGISVTPAQVDSAMLSDLGLPTNSGADYATARSGMEAAVKAKLGSTGLNLAEYRRDIQAQALAVEVKKKLVADYPKVGPEAKYETIAAPSQGDAQKFLDRLNSGTDWEALASEIHNNPNSGSLQQNDFQPKLQVDDKLVDPLFQLDPGGHTGVVATLDGKFVIARLIEKDEQHPISDDQMTAIAPKLYSNWLVDMRKTLSVKDSISDTQKLFAMERSDYKPKSQSQGQPQVPVPQPVNPQQAPQFNPANLPAGISTPTGGFGSGAVPAPVGTQGP
jgi:hypothetical protein